ncbi:zinc ribbon domain-containing protein [Mucilaginibacter celer]|uniref:Zinc-ribbon domain-containing protein n=1 Tax=Mucilaginibacter celer TaxID=2305508 RepID=A0A494VP11_9SPHI|nr:zinc ribbon domain-containing protein [Mucilaginibacter celer]AYL95979.1 zinc-ribbon domain-containing protein [Mucilaginibacter celer]
MENQIPAAVVPAERCTYCNTEIKAEDTFCTQCGYPVKGTETEQNHFISEREIQEIDLFTYNKSLRQATNTLYYLSGIFVFAALIYFGLHKDDPDVVAVVITNIIMAAIFLVLGSYSKRKPLACLVSGLSLYVIVQVLNAVVSPTSLLQGILVKIIIIGYMIRGIKSAMDVEKIRKENNIA